MNLKKQELQYQIDRNRAEDERRNSAAAKGKMFGDAMRNSAIRMVADPIDTIPFSEMWNNYLKYTRYLHNCKLCLFDRI